MFFLHPWYHTLLVNTAFTISFGANSYLVLAIVCFSKPYIGTYRYLLIIFSIFNVIYSLIHALLAPVIHVHRMSFMVFSSRPLPVWLNRILTCVFASCFAQSLCLFALHFIFRYVHAVRPEWRFLFNKKRWLGSWTVIYLLIAFIYGLVCYLNFGKTPTKDHYWNEELVTNYGVNATDIGYIAPLYILKDRIQEVDLLGVVIVSLVIGATLITIPICGISIWRGQSSISVISVKLRVSQHQLFIVLLVQTFFAMTFTFLPSITVIITSIFGPKIGYGGNFISLMLTVFSIVDPLILLITIECYRKAVPRITLCKCYNTSQVGMVTVRPKTESLPVN